MNNRITPDKNIKRRFCQGSTTLDNYPGQKHKTSICRQGSTLDKPLGRDRPWTNTLDKTLDKNTIYIDCCLSRVSCRLTSCHERIPKDGVKLRRRLQVKLPMTSQNCQTGGRV